MPGVLLGQDNIQENKDKPQEIEFTAGFMVLLTKDGVFTLESNLDRPVVVDRAITPQEIKAAVAIIASDIQVQETAILSAEVLIHKMQEQAMAAYQAQQNQQALNKIGNLRG